MACAWDFQFRVLLLGDSGVGKTSLLRWYTDGEFSSSTGQTVGVDFCSRVEEPEDGVKVRLQFWDTAGQERYRAVTRSYYRNASAVILLFDLTARPSFDNILNWYQEVIERTRPEPLIYLLLGTKSDLRAQRTVTREEGQTLADTLKAPYLETSARTGSNITAALSLLCRELLKMARQEKTQGERWKGRCTTVPEAQHTQKRTCAC
ncbi:ras-related protein Rab-39B-like [Spea bombifrons]|uniref:ras-related protein Rab-39B-like n=1 Tax=Spea bombifrons TaxID=233779 RepID=UPI00234A69A3|nr:ras-related protein Rab-39B-like [Spea bombifrons]